MRFQWLPNYFCGPGDPLSSLIPCCLSESADAFLTSARIGDNVGSQIKGKDRKKEEKY